MGGARCRSGDAVEAREVRARAALENARRIAIAERRDEIALHLRLAGEKRLIDRGIVETRHRTGVEPERARGKEEIGALQARVTKSARLGEPLVSRQHATRVGWRAKFGQSPVK